MNMIRAVRRREFKLNIEIDIPAALFFPSFKNIQNWEELNRFNHIFKLICLCCIYIKVLETQLIKVIDLTMKTSVNAIGIPLYAH